MGVLAQNIDFGRTVDSVLGQVARIVPRLVVFALIVVVGWFVARLLDRAVAAILRRVHFDRFALRGVVSTAMSRSKYDASGLLGRVVFFAVLLVTLQLAFNVFGPNPVSNVLWSVVSWLPRLAAAILIIIVASAIAHAVRELVTAAIGGLPYGRVLATAASVFIIGLGIIAAVNQIEIATTVTEPVLITVLATIGAILAIGVGGGMIRPMQERWERILTRAERDAASARTAGYARGREDAERGAGTPAEAPPPPAGTQARGAQGRGAQGRPPDEPPRP